LQPISNKELVKKAFESYNNKLNIKAYTNNTDIHSIGNYNADKLAEESIELSNKKIYIKDEIKKLGCLWNGNFKKLYYYPNNKYKTDILARLSG
jgi:hypothetical protein